MDGTLSPVKARRFPTLRAITALLLREMATTYGRSPGGYAWAVLEPVAALAVLSVAFSIAFASPALGSNFPLFYATGYLPFMMYSQLSAKIGQAIRFSKPLLFYPAATYSDALFARWILGVLTHLSIFVIVLTGIVQIFGLTPILNIPALVNAVAMAALLALGVGTLNCFLSSMFPVWEQVWVIVNRPFFIISGVFFLFENMPEPVRALLWFNPLAHVIGEMRRAVYASYDGAFVSPVYVYSVALGSLILGLVFLNRYHRVILNER
ncbi:ABC transporter permease [Sinisalibacter aestuarii]|uniref:Transport permease protein n=1 Tax=Sinisalibacter aestuarii TaxID=2949426 RepID=A0ABQ5LUF8_9RHOB|nr:ABC transporter permease [Sinisalibacter aestuarii]GKY88622.1 transport permease protein [Sinisalibacter aestuarii]